MSNRSTNKLSKAVESTLIEHLTKGVPCVDNQGDIIADEKGEPKRRPASAATVNAAIQYLARVEHFETLAEITRRQMLKRRKLDDQSMLEAGVTQAELAAPVEKTVARRQLDARNQQSTADCAMIGELLRGSSLNGATDAA